VVGGFAVAILTSRSNKSTINKYNGYTETPAEVSEKEWRNRVGDITKLGTLRSQGAITNEEYERMVNALSVVANHAYVKPQSKGFPKSLYLLPVCFGIIGGIIGALIAARVYKTKWWQIILVGIITSVIAYVIYAAIIPMPQ
jgi:uncharacterized membrane protein YeaQ/YmgE (transglycosylase-associated protein family)